VSSPILLVRAATCEAVDGRIRAGGGDRGNVCDTNTWVDVNPASLDVDAMSGE